MIKLVPNVLSDLSWSCKPSGPFAGFKKCHLETLLSESQREGHTQKTTTNNSNTSFLRHGLHGCHGLCLADGIATPQFHRIHVGRIFLQNSPNKQPEEIAIRGICVFRLAEPVPVTMHFIIF